MINTRKWKTFNLFSLHHLLSVPDIHPMHRFLIQATALEVEVW